MRGPLRAQIKVDYTKSTEDLITNLLVNQITVQHSLDLLALCRFDQHSRNPSRYPDLNQSSLHALPPSLPVFRGREDPLCRVLKSRRETLNNPAVVLLNACSMGLSSNSNITITASGLVLGTIDTILPDAGRRNDRHHIPLHNPDLGVPIEIGFLRHCDQLFSDVKLKVPSSRPSELSSTNIHGQRKAVRLLRERLEDEDRHFPDPATKNEPQSIYTYEEFLDRAISWAEEHCHWYPVFSKLAPVDTTEVSGTGYEERFFCLETTEDQVYITKQKRATILHAMKGRCRFTMDTGLIGVGPPEMLESDEIVLFDATSFGFAVRGSKLIGQVLVCPPLLPGEYPVKEWLDSRLTRYPDCWREPVRKEFVLK